MVGGNHLQYHLALVLRNITVQYVSVSRHGVGRRQQVGFLLCLTEDNCSAVGAAVHLQCVDDDGRACSRWTRDSQVLPTQSTVPTTHSSRPLYMTRFDLVQVTAGITTSVRSHQTQQLQGIFSSYTIQHCHYWNEQFQGICSLHAI